MVLQSANKSKVDVQHLCERRVSDAVPGHCAHVQLLYVKRVQMKICDEIKVGKLLNLIRQLFPILISWFQKFQRMGMQCEITENVINLLHFDLEAV